MIISLIGMPGSYKTSSGRILADRLNYCFLDTDSIIKDRLDKNMTRIFKELGEETFRLEETEALRDCLLLDNTVISCGGGIILNETNRSLIRDNSYSVWLDTSPEYIFDRVSDDRPLFKGKSEDEISEIKNDRDPLYEELGKIRISTDNLSPEQVADEIFKILSEKGICGGGE